MTTITAQGLLSAAQDKTRLDDFGEPAFREALDNLVDAANSEATLHERGTSSFEKSLVGYLCNRLKIVDYLARHPHLLEQPVEKPLFVFGLPRTGTTLTINLLSADPERRCYTRWEALDSVPPAPATGGEEDPRYLAEKQRIDLSVQYMPHLSAIHHEEPDSPSECQFAMAMSFTSQLFDSILHIPSYHDWLLHRADYEPAFRLQKMQLQLMQANKVGRWTLKNPWHPLFLDALTNVYPDAQLVMTHRDPLEVVGSACSLCATVRPIYSDAIDGRRVADMLMDTFDVMLERQTRFRKEHGADAIFDIDYAEQVADPVGQMKKLYARFEEPFTDDVEAAMARCLAQNPKGKFGKHSYTLEQFGVSEEEVCERYAGYREQHGFA